MDSSTATDLPVQPTALAGENPHTPLPEIVEALKRVSALHGLSDSELEWLATHGEEVAFPAGAPLFREGDPATKMSILLTGEVHVRRSQGGLALFVGRAGQITGLLALLADENPRRARICVDRCLGDSARSRYVPGDAGGDSVDGRSDVYRYCWTACAR